MVAWREETSLSQASEILDRLMDELSRREGRVILGLGYAAEPILRTGRELLTQRAEDEGRRRRIREMRSLAAGHGWQGYGYGGSRLFFEQARLMEDYEDDLPFSGAFDCYYPTYEDMSERVLRGYFSWRTRLRRGELPEARLSFLFVYVYELLCGVGVPQGPDGLAELGRVRESYASLPGMRPLEHHLRSWMLDYVVYFGLDPQLLGGAADEDLGFSASVLCLRSAEGALLRGPDPGVWPSAPGVPSAHELLGAMARLSRYRIERSKLLSQQEELLEQLAAAVFARLVDHCRRRRRRGFVDGLFGEACSEFHPMFAAAVFHAPEEHPDADVSLPGGVTYRCREGRWKVERPCRSHETSVELGDVLHALDRTLRERLGGLPALKERPLPKYLQRIISQETDSLLRRRAAEEAARVRIDRTRLSGIRNAALRTREALLTDEEREDEARPGPLAPAQEEAAAGEGPLSGLQRRILRELLDGRLDMSAWEAGGTLLSVELDRINEQLFDLIGDSVLEFAGDEPQIVEDYREEIREVLS